MRQRFQFEIGGKLPGLNDYIRACRANKYMAAKMKREAEELIIWAARRADTPDFTEPVKVYFEWREGNRRRDLDNVAFAKKFVFDALVKTGILSGDDRKHVEGFEDTFRLTPGQWSCRVTIIEE